MSSYRPTIGLEVHAELNTATKMFCNSKNAPHESEPNTNVCPVCLAHPGTLPVVNKEAVHAVLRVGAALSSELADYSEFDRKSYFYPDIPKNYQISQYEYPLVSKGILNGVEITRVHLEEDTARSSHVGGSSLVDFNRAGVPLMELVTEPVIHDATTASSFARELQLLLRTLGVSDANLEKGEMRVEANISVSKDEQFGTKVEVKNLNSFRAVERAIDFEIARQSKVLSEGGRITQETRGWDEDRQITFSQRAKEGSTDYRYFPEPDIPKLKISSIPEWSVEALRASLPELPWKRRERLESIGLKKADAEAITGDTSLSDYFDELSVALGNELSLIQMGANYLLNDVAGQEPPDIARFSELLKLIASGDLSSRGGKDVLKELLEGNQNTARKIAEDGKLLQNSDRDALQSLISSVLEAEQKVVEEYRQGKETALEYLLGAVMRESKGSANPVITRELLLENLS